MTRRILIDEPTLRTDWATNLRLIDMAVRYGCSVSHVSTTAKRLGLPTRHPGKPRRPQEPIGLTGGRWVPGQRGVLHWQEAS